MRLFPLTTLCLSTASLLPIAAQACPEGALCLDAPQGAEFQYKIGDTLPRGQYMMLLNSEYYGLPPAPEDGLYFRVHDRVMVVRPDTLEIVADVTENANNTF